MRAEYSRDRIQQSRVGSWIREEYSKVEKGSPVNTSSKSYFLIASAPRSGLGAAISVAIAHSSLACCNSASAGQRGVAASKIQFCSFQNLFVKVVSRILLFCALVPRSSGFLCCQGACFYSPLQISPAYRVGASKVPWCCGSARRSFQGKPRVTDEVKLAHARIK